LRYINLYIHQLQFNIAEIDANHRKGRIGKMATKKAAKKAPAKKAAKKAPAKKAAKKK
jgi:hypothetical protein